MPLSRPEKQRFLLGVYEEEMAALEEENARLRELLAEERAKLAKGPSSESCAPLATCAADDPPARSEAGDRLEEAEQAPRHPGKRLQAVRSFLYPGEAQVLANDALESVRRKTALLMEEAQRGVQAVQAHTRDLLSIEDMGRAASDEMALVQRTVQEDLQAIGNDIWEWSRGWVGEQGTISGATLGTISAASSGETADARSRGTMPRSAREPEFAAYLTSRAPEVQIVDDLVPLEPSMQEAQTVTNLVWLE